MLIINLNFTQGREMYSRFRQILKDRRAIRDATNWDHRKRSVLEQKKRLQEQYRNLYVSLPEVDQMSLVLDLIQHLADSAGVQLDQIRPANPLRAINHDELPFEVELSGTYPDICHFIHQIETSSYLMKIKDLTVTKLDSEQPFLHTELGFQVIVLREKPDTL